MIRISTLLAVVVVLLIADSTTCDAQLFRRRTQQAPQYHQQEAFAHAARTTTQSPRNHSTTAAQPFRFPTQSYFEPRRPAISRLLDGKMTYQYRDPAEMESRYISGFHQSFFYNIGIPNGDIGQRGNGLILRPW